MMTTTNYIVYSIPNCKFCEYAKRDLRNKHRTFSDIAVDMKPDLAMDLIEKTGSKTWPKVFYRGNFIGGYSELKEFLK